MKDRDNTLRLAREADPCGVDGRLYAIAELSPETLERFAALVRAEALEEAKTACLAHQWPGRRHSDYTQGQNDAIDKCVESIRALMTKEKANA